MAASMTSSASRAFARYSSNACSGVSVFAYSASCAASGIANEAAAFAADFDGPCARLAVFFPTGLAVVFDFAFVAMINAP
jgi:hypothetical protein